MGLSGTADADIRTLRIDRALEMYFSICHMLSSKLVAHGPNMHGAVDMQTLKRNFPAFLVTFLTRMPVRQPAGANARPLRQLHQLGYVPQGQGCDGLIVTATADTSSNSWWDWGEEPSIQGTVQMLNPKEYGFPINNIQVTAQSSEGLLYSAQAVCQNGQPGTFVPVNPIPYTYGTATCSYTIQLDHRVFSSYAASVGSSGSSGSGQLSYFPSNGGNFQPTWTVAATATIGLSKAQCSSAPVVVDTQSWWSWFTSWFSRSHSSENSSSDSSADSGNSGNGIGSADGSAGGSTTSSQGITQPAVGSASSSSDDGSSATITTGSPNNNNK